MTIASRLKFALLLVIFGAANSTLSAGGAPQFTIHETGEHKIQLKKNLTTEVLDWLFLQSR